MQQDVAREEDTCESMARAVAGRWEVEHQGKVHVAWKGERAQLHGVSSPVWFTVMKGKLIAQKRETRWNVVQG